jgi:hypothetical protein
MKRFEKKIPRVIALRDRVAKRPRIAAYLASERRIPFSQWGIWRYYKPLDADRFVLVLRLLAGALVVQIDPSGQPQAVVVVGLAVAAADRTEFSRASRRHAGALALIVGNLAGAGLHCAEETRVALYPGDCAAGLSNADGGRVARCE